MKGYSKISVLAFMAALGGNAVVSGGASAQQYTPVSVDDSVQVNWDVADGIGGQPTVPNYLSPSVSREHISIAGSDLIYPETRPHSEFLAADRFAQDVSGTTYGDGFETVVIDGAGSNDIPTRSQFYGVPGVTTSPSYDDGANQVITLNRPEPAAAPRAKPAAPVAAAKAGSGSAPVPLSKPTPTPQPAQAPAPAAEMAQASESPAAPKAEPAPEAPKVETKPAEIEPPKAPPLPAEETRQAPPPPAPEPVIPDKSNVPEAPSPAPDTTTSPQEMLEQRSSNETPVAPAPAPEPAAEAAAVPPAAKDPVASTPSGAGEYSLAFGSGSFELNNAARSQLDSIVKSMGSDENMRIQLQAYAEGDSNNASKARRLSLSRALQVRSYLIDKGVRSTRIDVRALGANVPSGPADRVDIKTVQR